MTIFWNIDDGALILETRWWTRGGAGVWEEDQVALLVGPGKMEVRLGRREMIPLDAEGDRDEGERGTDDSGEGGFLVDKIQGR